jgi:hypothetical protein
LVLSVIGTFICFFSSQLAQTAEAKSGFLEWLKWISELRGPEVILYYPHGKIFLGDSLIFHWSCAHNPDHFIIRITEESENIDDLEPREIWVSRRIPGDIRSHAAEIHFEDPVGKSYYWLLETYDKTSADPGTKYRQPFSFLSERESTEIRGSESTILRWIQERPTEKHLVLLLGSYYASQHMYFHTREIFAKFLRIDDHTVYSYKALATLILNRLSQDEEKRNSLRTKLERSNSLSDRVEMLSELLRLNLMLLDYERAVWCIDELIGLSEAHDYYTRADWQKNKERIIAEQRIAEQIFPG